MDVDVWHAIFKLAVVAAGVLLGSAAVGSACWMWINKQVFGLGGSALCGVGVTLIGLSVWQSIKIEVGPTGIAIAADTAVMRATARSEAVQVVAEYRKDPSSVDRLEKIIHSVKQLSDTKALDLLNLMEKKLTTRSASLQILLNSIDTRKMRFKSAANARTFLSAWVANDDGTSENLKEWELALLSVQQ